MPAVVPCVPSCCTTVPPTQVPGTEGEAGSDGTDGSNGVSAYTVLTVDFLIPAIGDTDTAQVGTSVWMVVGQKVFMGDGTDQGTFEVISKPGTSSVVLEFMGYTDDSAQGSTINAGAGVTPSGVEGPAVASPLPIADGGTNSITATAARAALGVGGASLTVYAAGTAYQLTNTAALLNFGTTDPSLTINAVGTWLLLARVRIDYTGATFAAVRTVTIKLRRTNNTAADLGNGSAGFLTDIITTLTYTATHMTLQPIIYVTTNATDIIELWGSIDVVPTAGSIDAVEASIVAVKLFDQTI